MNVAASAGISVCAESKTVTTIVNGASPQVALQANANSRYCYEIQNDLAEPLFVLKGTAAGAVDATNATVILPGCSVAYDGTSSPYGDAIYNGKVTLGATGGTVKARVTEYKK